MGLLNKGRCPICDWPLAEDTGMGCTLDSCSFRPIEGSPEYFRIRDRRERLARLKERVADDNALMDEIERDLRAAT